MNRQLSNSTINPPVLTGPPPGWVESQSNDNALQLAIGQTRAADRQTPQPRAPSLLSGPPPGWSPELTRIPQSNAHHLDNRGSTEGPSSAPSLSSFSGAAGPGPAPLSSSRAQPNTTTTSARRSLMEAYETEPLIELDRESAGGSDASTALINRFRSTIHSTIDPRAAESAPFFTQRRDPRQPYVIHDYTRGSAAGWSGKRLKVLAVDSGEETTLSFSSPPSAPDRSSLDTAAADSTLTNEHSVASLASQVYSSSSASSSLSLSFSGASSSPSPLPSFSPSPSSSLPTNTSTNPTSTLLLSPSLSSSPSPSRRKFSGHSSGHISNSPNSTSASSPSSSGPNISAAKQRFTGELRQELHQLIHEGPLEQLLLLQESLLQNQGKEFRELQVAGWHYEQEEEDEIGYDTDPQTLHSSTASLSSSSSPLSKTTAQSLADAAIQSRIRRVIQTDLHSTVSAMTRTELIDTLHRAAQFGFPPLSWPHLSAGASNRALSRFESVPTDVWWVIASYLDAADLLGRVFPLSRWCMRRAADYGTFFKNQRVFTANPLPPSAVSSILFAKMPNLTAALLSRPELSASTKERGAHVLSDLSAHCPLLERLELAGREHFPFGELTVKWSAWPHLTALDLSNCTEVTDVVLARIAFSCVELRSIVLSGCFRVSPMGVINISQRCNQLSRIDLKRCRSISDNAVVSLAQRCPLLSSVDLSFTAATEFSIRELLLWCPSLEHLDVSGCAVSNDLLFNAITCHSLKRLILYFTHITADGVAVLMRARPDLQIYSSEEEQAH